MMAHPFPALTELSRCSTTGSVGNRRAMSEAATPSSRATATAQATLAGGALTPSIRASSAPPAATTSEAPWRTACTSSPVAPVVPQRTTRVPEEPAVGQLLQARVVDVEDGRLHSGEDLGLGRHDALLRPEALQVDGADGRYDPDARAHPAAQLRDLTGAVGAHLGHEHLRARSQLLIDGPGQPGAVVEAAGRGQHGPAACDEVGDVALGARLAV